jgi:hypothetical protein
MRERAKKQNFLIQKGGEKGVLRFSGRNISITPDKIYKKIL